MRWEAFYDDGDRLSEDGRPGGAYAAIDRARLIAFRVEGDLIEVVVSRGDILVWREVFQAKVGSPPVFVKCFVALIHHTGEMDIWVARPSVRRMEVTHGTSYDEVDVYPPVLLDHEVPT